jgi:hypothetical protein
LLHENKPDRFYGNKLDPIWGTPNLERFRHALTVYKALRAEKICRKHHSDALRRVAAALAVLAGGGEQQTEAFTYGARVKEEAASTYGGDSRQVSRWLVKLRDLQAKRPNILEGALSSFADPMPIAPSPRCGTLVAAPTPAPIFGGFFWGGILRNRRGEEITGEALHDAKTVFYALRRELICRSNSNTALAHVAAALAVARGATQTAAADAYGAEPRQVSRWVAKLHELQEKRPNLLQNELSAPAVPSAPRSPWRGPH